MSRKNYLITMIIGLLVILFVILCYVKNSQTQTYQHSSYHALVTPTIPPSAPQTFLQLFPNPAQPDSEGNIDIDVSMNTYNNKVTAVQLTIKYNPSALQFISIRPDDAFYNAKILSQEIDSKAGIITYSMQLPTQLMSRPAHGNDAIADLEFKAKHNGETMVKILSASVTSPNSPGSVLKQTANTIVKMNY